MKKVGCFLSVVSIIMALSCKSSKNITGMEKPLQETLDEKNKHTVSLLYRIQKLKGITVRNGIPVFLKGNNSISSSVEPLYILNDYVVGNSFESVDELIESVNVKKVETLEPLDAALYGTRASNGVIKITTYQ